MPVLSTCRRFITSNVFRSTLMTRVSGLIINRVYPDIMGWHYVLLEARGGCSPAEVRLNHHAEQYRLIPGDWYGPASGIALGNTGRCLIMCPLSRHDIRHCGAYPGLQTRLIWPRGCIMFRSPGPAVLNPPVLPLRYDKVAQLFSPCSLKPARWLIIVQVSRSYRVDRYHCIDTESTQHDDMKFFSGVIGFWRRTSRQKVQVYSGSLLRIIPTASSFLFRKTARRIS